MVVGPIFLKIAFEKKSCQICPKIPKIPDFLNFNLFLGKSIFLLFNSDGFFGRSIVFIVSRNTQVTFCIQIKAHFDFWNTTRSRRNSLKIELTSQAVVSGELAFSFKNLTKNITVVLWRTKKTNLPGLRHQVEAPQTTAPSALSSFPQKRVKMKLENSINFFWRKNPP